MPKVLYVGFGDLIKRLEGKLTSNAAIEFNEVLQLGNDAPERALEQADVFLIGPYTLEPVKQVQRANQLNSQVSILVLLFPDQYQAIKQRIQFAYNIGKNVTFVPYDLGKDITLVLDSAIMRSQQRKSFSRIQERKAYPAPANRETTFQNLGVFLENAPIGAIVFNQDKRVISANFKAKQLFRPLFESGQPLTWTDLFPDQDPTGYPEMAPYAEESYNKVIKVNSQFLEINLSPVQLEKDEPHFLLLLNDVTGKINLEHQLKSKVDELEFLNREMDDFINVVSHDFKTPLTSIGLLAEIALKERSQEKQLVLIRQIQQSSNKLRELLKGLNVLVDTQKDRTDKLETVDFAERLGIVLTEYQQHLADTGSELQADFSEAPAICYFKAHIDSFLSNLITNAIKYRNKDKPLQILVSSRREKEFIVLSVKDNGIGIDLTRHMNKLFQPFKRLSDQGTGSGLGLSIIKRMIEKDHGYLEVFSEPGSGTEFKAYLREQKKQA